jgi:hypothetical protein
MLVTNDHNLSSNAKYNVAKELAAITTNVEFVTSFFVGHLTFINSEATSSVHVRISGRR